MRQSYTPLTQDAGVFLEEVLHQEIRVHLKAREYNYASRKIDKIRELNNLDEAQKRSLIERIENEISQHLEALLKEAKRNSFKYKKKFVFLSPGSSDFLRP